jgi:phage-related tail fiber protein
MTDIPGAAYKATCRVASTANITTLSGLLTIDGIVLVANDRVLVKDQTASQNNGIYIASAGAWVRSVGANVSSEINTAIVTIDLGTVNTGSIFTNKFKSSDTLGTTVMPWFKVYSTDWFAPLTSVGAAGPVLSSGGLTPVISMPAATTSVAGHLTAADWNTFNNKQPAGSYLTGTKVDSFNTRTGPVTLSSADVTNALTYTPFNQMAQEQ